MSILERANKKTYHLNNLEESLLDTPKELSFEEITEKVIKETLEESDKFMEEAFAGGMQMRTHEAKKEAAISAIAVSLAKRNNDPLYGILKRHRHMWKQAKNDIVMRYRGQAEMRFQQKQSQS